MILLPRDDFTTKFRFYYHVMILLPYSNFNILRNKIITK